MYLLVITIPTTDKILVITPAIITAFDITIERLNQNYSIENTANNNCRSFGSPNQSGGCNPPLFCINKPCIINKHLTITLKQVTKPLKYPVHVGKVRTIRSNLDDSDLAIYRI